MVNQYKKIVLHGLELISDYNFRILKSLLLHDLKLTKKMQDDYDRVKIADLMEEKFPEDAGLSKLIEVCEDMPELGDRVDILRKKLEEVQNETKRKPEASLLPLTANKMEVREESKDTIPESPDTIRTQFLEKEPNLLELSATSTCPAKCEHLFPQEYPTTTFSSLQDTLEPPKPSSTILSTSRGSSALCSTWNKVPQMSSMTASRSVQTIQTCQGASTLSHSHQATLKSPQTEPSRVLAFQMTPAIITSVQKSHQEPIATVPSSYNKPQVTPTTVPSSVQTLRMTTAPMTSSFNSPQVSAAAGSNSYSTPKIAQATVPSSVQCLRMPQEALSSRAQTFRMNPAPMTSGCNSPQVSATTGSNSYSTPKITQATVPSSVQCLRMPQEALSSRAQTFQMNPAAMTTGCNSPQVSAAAGSNSYNTPQVTPATVPGRAQTFQMTPAAMSNGCSSPQVSPATVSRSYNNPLVTPATVPSSVQSLCLPQAALPSSSQMFQMTPAAMFNSCNSPWVSAATVSNSCNNTPPLSSITVPRSFPVLPVSPATPFKKPRLKNVPKQPSEEDGHQQGSKQVMVLKATEPFTYDMRRDKRMFHATVATETEFFRVKVFEIALKEKFIPKKVIVISDYLGSKGFLEIHKFSCVSEVKDNNVMNIPPSLIKRASATPKINMLCTQKAGTFVNGIFTVYVKTVKSEFIYYGIEDGTGRMEVVVYGQFARMYCEPGDKLRLVCFELDSCLDKWQLRSGLHSYMQVIQARKRSCEPPNPYAIIETAQNPHSWNPEEQW